jgi:hypothetical protein
MNRLILLPLLLILPASLYAAEIGRVLLAGGEAFAVRGSEVLRLSLDSAIHDRDVLRTGASANLQVRFNDDSIVSLRENSELQIAEFRFAGKEDGSERAFFRLLRGGLRTITGLIGRSNHKNYSLGSVTSTIGIRGTDYAATLCQGDCRNSDGSVAPDGLYGRVIGQSAGTNRIIVSNERFERSFGINQNFYVADARSEPRQLLEAPPFVASRLESRGQAARKGEQAATGNERAAAGGSNQESRITTPPAPPPEAPAFVATEQRGSGGSLSLLTPNLGIVASDGQGGGGAFIFPGMLTLSGTTVVGINASGIDFDGEPFSFTAATVLAAVTDIGASSDIPVYWGRWTGGTINDNGFVYTIGPAPNGHFHYIYGTLTPPDIIGAKTGTATFIRVGGTTPTDSVSPVNTASGFSFGSIGVDFTTRAAVLSSLTMSFPTGVNYNFSSVPLQIRIQGSGATVEGNFTNPTGCSGGVCATSAPATLKVNGGFVGPSGNHIGASFSTQSSPAGTTSSVQLFKCPTCP